MSIPDTGNTSTISFTTSGFTALYTQLGGFEQERGKLPTSHLGTSVTKTSKPEPLKEPGSFDGEFYYDPDEQPPIDADPETITITYPTGATVAGTGYLTKSKTPDLSNGALMMGGYTVEWDGETGPVHTDAP